jgi:REP element-mobilizing transposase RayT
MSPPRPIEPGTTFFITVRAVNRSFRFVPKPDVVASIDFTFKAMAEQFADKIAIHEYEFLSNHFHLLGTDLTGHLPAFMRELNRALSRQLNALRGIRGSNIEKGYNLCAVDMETGDRAVAHAEYILTQAVSAHLVERATEWKAPNSHVLEYGVPVTVYRPECGLWSNKVAHKDRRASRRSGRARYAGHSKAPEQATFVLTRPPIMREVSDAELRSLIRDRVKKVEDELIAERKRTGRRVAGWKRVVSRHYLEIPKETEEYFARVPHFSASTPERRAVLAGRRRAFLEAYRVALAAYRQGLRETVFPAGTWLMRLVHNVRCEALACA